MKHNKKNIITVIRRSCINGLVVWIYRGPSKDAAKKAYLRACKQEVKRVKTWMQKINDVQRSISLFISSCMDSMPINANLTDTQKNAVKQLQHIRNEQRPCHMDFYNHIIEEARRKNETSSRWREQRNKWF